MTMYAPASPEHPASTDDPITTIVIAGATGDLAQRKLLPALYHLWIKGRLAPNVPIVGFSRAMMSTDEFREFMWRGIQEIGGIEANRDQWDAFAPRLSYFGGDLGSTDDVGVLGRHLDEIEGGDPHANRLFYLSITPAIFEPAVTSLNACGLVEESPGTGWRRVVVEKPFGRDLATANALNRTIHRVFREEQVYRIDHYLGKETVQNLLVFRFANAIFEPLWSRNYIDNIQLTVAESLSIADRAPYYDRAGVLRDMFQSHLLQLLAVVAMEPPATFEADALRNEKVKVLDSVRHVSPQDAPMFVVQGQYDGYLDEPGVPPDSRTATYAAMRLDIDNWRWQGVPFYLRSGKALSDKRTEVLIQFRRPPHLIFPQGRSGDITSNTLSICLQPNEGVHLEFQAKTPDSLLDLRPVNLEFHYEDSFGGQEIPDAYERLLLDALNGDASLFIRSDEIEESWSIIDPLITGLSDPLVRSPEIYDPGTEGPFGADDFLARDGRAWLGKCLGG